MQQTSIEAFIGIAEELGRRQMEVYKVLLDSGEMNNLMIAKKLNLPINSITPRVLELRKMDLVEEAYKDSCPFTGRYTIFWRAIKR